jgi:AraC family transcriptional regulator
MSNGLVYLRPSRVIYARAFGAYAASAPQAWDHLVSWLDKAGVPATLGRSFGLARDNPVSTSADKCRYDACVDLDPFFEERALRELGVLTLPGGSYLRQRKSDSYQEIAESLADLYAGFEPPAGLKIDDKRPMVTIHLDDPRRLKRGPVRGEVCVPVSAKTARDSGDDDMAA